MAGDEETLWATRQVTNRLVRWDLTHEPSVGRVVERSVAVFERHNPPHFSWPRSYNRDILIDDKLLWIVWHGPDPKWTQRQVRPGEDMPDVPWRQIFDGWLDLVDPASGRTIARHRFDGVTLGFAAGSRYLAAYHESDAGVPYIHLLEPRVSGLP